MTSSSSPVLTQKHFDWIFEQACEKNIKYFVEHLREKYDRIERWIRFYNKRLSVKNIQIAVDEMFQIQIAAERYGINYNQIINGMERNESVDPLFYL
jgi:hypothetical protein